MSSSKKTPLASVEVMFISNESLNLISAVEGCVKDRAVKDKEIVRLMALPMLYSAWERFFHLGTAICIKSIQVSAIPCGAHPSSLRSLLILKEKFFMSFLDKIKFGKAGIDVVSEFFTKIEEWNEKSFITDPEAVIITKSNVNTEVVSINSRAIGMDKLKQFSKIDFSKLEELVGQRNGIGHGKILKAPGERDLRDLIQYTKGLIKSYRSLILAWLKIQVRTNGK